MLNHNNHFHVQGARPTAVFRLSDSPGLAVPSNSNALRICGSRWASTSSPFSTPSVRLKISVFSRLAQHTRDLFPRQESHKRFVLEISVPHLYGQHPQHQTILQILT